MGELVCFMHSLSFPSGMPSQLYSHGIHDHDFGDSVCFGRFASESLGWEKWSTFPCKRYAEEARSYVQPGSVALKKAFFETHYKRFGAQKAAVLLPNQEKPKSQVEEIVCGTNHCSQDLEVRTLLDTHVSPAVVVNLEPTVNEEQQIINQNVRKVIDVEKHPSAVVAVPSETNKITISHSMPKIHATPTVTPSKFTNEVDNQPLATPSVKRRMETPVHPSPVGSKTPAQKWHIFSAVFKSLRACRNKLQSLTLSERAARSEQKLEGKSNEKEAQKVPLPSFYKFQETPKNPIKKTPQANAPALTVTPARKPPPTISQPPSTNKSSRRLKKTNDQTSTSHPLSLLEKLFAKFKSFLCNFQL